MPVGAERAIDRLIAEGLGTPALRPKQRGGRRVRAAAQCPTSSPNRGGDRLLRHVGSGPLVVEEPGSAQATQLWDAAERVVTVRLTCAEARAALAQAQRVGRLTPKQVRDAVTSLDGHFDQLDVVETDAELTASAGALAEARQLRGYDAVHLAAAVRVRDDDLVLVAGDTSLLEAARAEGIATAKMA
jgi:predicted nucleic acid-binding protein